MQSLALFVSLLAAPSQSIEPIADGMVQERDPDRSFGSDALLQVRGLTDDSRRSYLRFQLTGVSGVQGAKLRLHCIAGSPYAGRLHLADDDGWTEPGLTWRNKPGLLQEIAVLGKVTAGAYVDIDVSSIVTGPGTYVFALTRGGKHAATFSSREGATPPQLVFDPVARGVWSSAAELALLPESGAAWDALAQEASLPAGTPDLSDQDDDTDMRVLAKAIVHARTGDAGLRTEVIQACLAAIGTEAGGRTLALGRNLAPYVIAADLVGLPPADDALFSAWLLSCLTKDLDGRTLRSTHEDRPNNWGTHAGASRAAVAVYLGDAAEIDRCAQVFKGWLGDRSSYAGFDYGELWWQADASKPVGINPRGATMNGRSIDGVLPDDQRRGGAFTWPPPKENYVWEALQGALLQAVILHRVGYDTWNWEDQALLRAMDWLHDECDYPATGDDTWQPHLINWSYGTDFPAPVPSDAGKNMGFTDWTHASG